MAIIEASHNVVMLHMMRGMFDLLAEGVFFNRQVMFRQRATREMLLDQHRAINEALQRRDAARAARRRRWPRERRISRFVSKIGRCSDPAQRKAERNEEIALRHIRMHSFLERAHPSAPVSG
jgi:GntR family transcriptional regulator, transcriptional repressor for pyruvate dehydrogenase complex